MPAGRDVRVGGFTAAAPIQGYTELVAELKAATAGAPGALRRIATTANKPVIADAQARARAQGRASARAASTLRPFGTQAGSGVRFGDDRHPDAFGQEFGAAHDQPRRTRRRGEVKGWNQFPVWGGNGLTAGYFMYPAIRAGFYGAQQRFLAELDRLLPGAQATDTPD